MSRVMNCPTYSVIGGSTLGLVHTSWQQAFSALNSAVWQRLGIATMLAMMVFATTTLTATAPAHAAPKYAALVLDKYSGRVLFSRNADAPRYPASLTKIMTLYIVFEELAKENITLDTRWPVSRHAAGQAPSKLGLDVGDTITVEDAILALVTKSANDVAMVVAEGIGGTERKFAQRMTSEARGLGMARTTFRNPHGLPDKRQRTTARDMATLAQRIMDDFPQYYSYFSTESFSFRGRVFNNHNNLLGDYEGTNGIKTGYTRASGFNLTASVIRDGKHLVGVVLGGKTPRARDNHMVDILDTAFGKVPRRGRISIASAAPVPLPRPERAVPEQIEAPMVVAAATPLEDNMPAAPAAALLVEAAPASTVSGPIPVPRPAPRFMASLDPAPRTAAASDGEQRRLSVASAAPSITGFEDVTAWLVSPANARETGLDPISGTGAGDLSPYPELDAPAGLTANAWRIQIGAYSDAEEAGRRIQAAVSRAPSVLRGKGPATVPVKTASRTLYRSRFTGFNGEDQARNACTTLIREGISCITVPPDDWYAPTATN